MNALEIPLNEMNSFIKLKELLKEKTGLLKVEGCFGSQKVSLAAAIAPKEYSSLIICENDLKAKEVFEDWQLYNKDVLLYPARDMIFYKAAVHADHISKARMKVIKALNKQKKAAIVTGIGGCLDLLVPFEALKNKVITVNVGEETDMELFIKRLSYSGYERTSLVEAPGQFSVRGGIIDVYDITEDNPYRIEFWGDEIDSIRIFEAENQRSIETINKAEIYPASEDIESDGKNFCGCLTSSFIDYFPENTIYFLDDPARITENAKALITEFYNAAKNREQAGKGSADEAECVSDLRYIYSKLSKRKTVVFTSINGDGEIPLRYKGDINITVRSVMPYNNQFDMLVKNLKSYKKAKFRVILMCASRTRGRRLASDLVYEGLNAFFTENIEKIIAPSEIMILYGNVLKGFEYPLEKFALITESDMFGRKKKIKRNERRFEGKSIAGFSQLSAGDYVVHEFHGLGIYRGIEKIVRDGTSKDYIKIEYAKGDVLYVQASQIGMLQKYGSSKSHAALRLNSLTGGEWKRTKLKVRKAVKDIASELIKLYAKRQNSEGYIYGPDTIWQAEFEEMFPFEETEDQIRSMEEMRHDMETPGIMDRILCGDVGYGKTEVAIRAAFKAVQESKQVAVLVPTTILAQQHYLTFMQRMKDFPVKIDMLCRFRTFSQQKKTISNLKKGLIDIVIGTHRLLSKDVEYKDLGLLIVDEEQRFGVAHKEKIKELKTNVDVLTLSATPIPRTLHMGLIGIRDMSLLEMAPANRLPVQTYVMEYDPLIAKEAISREISRGGQIYYVYNRVSGVQEIADAISRMVPEANVAYAHGQMKERQLEQVMYGFINREIDVLVSTTIIETGMDISNVNTMIVHDADQFGLAQLYQLRGRIGRADRTAYAFFMYRPNKLLKEEAEKRLSSIREFTDLGSGIKIAMRDLEIRGAGNLLGGEQSGHIDDVGYDLYCKMLTEAVDEAKGISKEKESFETVIDININAYIPTEYIRNEKQRLEIYKKIGAIENENDMNEMLDELIDRFGAPKECVLNLLDISLLKSRAHKLYMSEVKQLRDEIKFSFYENAKINTLGLPELITKYKGRLRLYTKDVPYFIYSVPKSDKSMKILDELKKIFSDFTEYIAQAAQNSFEREMATSLL